MKKMLTIYLSVLFLIPYLSLAGYQLSKAEKLVNALIARTSESIPKRYGIKTVATRVGMPGGDVQILGLEFQINRPLTVDEARVILVNCVEDMLQEINSSKELKVHLHNYPFTAKNIEMGLFICDANGRDLYEPNISIVSADNGRMNYRAWDLEDPYKRESIHKETYEEALQIVKKQNLLRDR